MTPVRFWKQHGMQKQFEKTVLLHTNHLLLKPCFPHRTNLIFYARPRILVILFGYFLSAHQTQPLTRRGFINGYLRVDTKYQCRKYRHGFNERLTIYFTQSPLWIERMCTTIQWSINYPPCSFAHGMVWFTNITQINAIGHERSANSLNKHTQPPNSLVSNHCDANITDNNSYHMTLNEDGMRLLDNRPNEGGSYEQGQETRQSREAAAGDEGD